MTNLVEQFSNLCISCNFRKVDMSRRVDEYYYEYNYMLRMTEALLDEFGPSTLILGTEVVPITLKKNKRTDIIEVSLFTINHKRGWKKILYDFPLDEDTWQEIQNEIMNFYKSIKTVELNYRKRYIEEL